MNNVLNCTGHELKIPNVVASEGAYLFDENGKRYMDLESGVWCTALGHKNGRVNDAIKFQIDSIAHAGFCYSSEVVERAARSILSITGLDDGKCVFLCSGSEAIEILRQISRELSGGGKTLVLHDAYLGSYSSVLNRDEGWHLFDWRRCESCPHSEDCDPRCDQLRNVPDDVVEFVFEPGSASGFVKFPPRALIRHIVNKVRRGKGRIIANEVTTGIGRTGEWFGFHHYGMQPDMVAIGKGVGNGYPVSVAVLSSETARDLEERSFKYVQSHQNDPLGAAVALEVVQAIDDDDLIAGARRKGEMFLSWLNGLVDDEVVLGVRGRGLMFAVELADAQTGDAIYEELLEAGFIVCNRGGLFRIDPPLTISEGELGRFIDAFDDAVSGKRASLTL